METVFRFTFARPGFPADNTIRVGAARPSPFQNQLVAALAGDNARGQMLAIAGKYIATPGIARDYSAYSFGNAWAALEKFLQSTTPPQLDDLKTKIQKLFGAAPSALVNDPKLFEDDTRAADGLVAVRMLTSEQPAGFGATATVLRLAELIRAIVRNDPGLDASDVLGWVVVQPEKIFPLPRPVPAGKPATRPDTKQATIAQLTDRIATAKTALDELMTIEATMATVEDSFQPPPPVAVTPPSTMARLATTSGPVVGPSQPPTATRTAAAFTLAPATIKTLSNATTSRPAASIRTRSRSTASPTRCSAASTATRASSPRSSRPRRCTSG